ncbi:MAG TPA: hypothetical protein VFY44_04620 [Thermoleophilaceae bacterium]|nr:hypothetical protein [Thermoleophilaceae bacterium]
MLSRSLLGAAGVTLALALLPGSALSQTKTQGTNLSGPGAAASGAEAFGCETRWQPGLAYPGYYQREPTGHTTCTAFSPGLSTNDTHLVPGPGTVSKVRVLSGANPAPLRIQIVKRIFQTNPNPPYQITDAQCCTGTGSESVTFQPSANGVTEVALNPPLKVTTTPSTNGASGHHDIVAVSAVGPGNLPIMDLGENSLNAGIYSSTPTMQMFYPKVQTGLQGQAQHDYANYIVAMNYDWAAEGAGAGGGGGGGGGGTGTKVAPIKLKSKSLRLKKGKVKAKIACTAARNQACKGRARLRTATRKPKLLASKALNIKGGKSKTVTFSLSRKARKRVPRKSNKVTLAVDLGAAGSFAKAMKLKR